MIGRNVFYFVTGADTTGTGTILSGPITADFVLAINGEGQPALGCTDANPNPPSDIDNDLTGKIAFISRGVCSFVYKVQNAIAAGAVAAVIYNDPPRTPDVVTNLGSPADYMDTTSIPAAWLTYGMAQPIVDALAAGTALSGTLRPEAIVDAVEDTPQASAAAFGVPAPNPFSGSTSFKVTLTEPEAITVEVYNVQGRRVATLHDGVMAAGQTTVSFVAGDLPSGVYMVRATGEKFSMTRTVSVLR